MRKNQSFMVLAVFILILAIVLGSFAYLNAQKPYSGDIESITFGTLPQEYSSLAYIANDQHYFSSNGLNVFFKNYTSGLAAVNGMLNGEVDISSASEFVFVEGIMQNDSIYALGSLSKSLILYVVARTDAGISSISDLNGKKIGVSFGTFEQFYLGRFLDLNGINESKVTFLNVPFTQQPSALANGTVDAVATFQPYINQIETLLGNAIVMWPAQAGQSTYNEAICTETWAVAHPDLIVRFLKALNQAESFTINHPDQAMNIVAKGLDYTGSYIASVWPDYQFSVTLDQTFLLLMQDESRWLISNNLTSATTIPTFSNYVYVNGLESVNPGSVNIIG